ncbi:DMT family transporter [Desulfospira joergensenii]|uniref:DMT family transporter n=1 Tax=Desulfospira joergensenii TaxID=53329 RepID=UPI000411D34D|nr:DMT family transporter [Desulfospira joergensenii]
MKTRLYAYLNLTLAMVIVGSSMVFGKVITHAFPVFLASGLRFLIAFAVIMPILIFKERGLSRISGRDALRLIFMAFCGQFVFTVFVLWGLRYTSAIEGGIITSTSPAMMAVVTFLLFRERPGLVQGLAIVLVVAGVIMVNGLSGFAGFDMEADHLFGNLLMVGAVAGEAFFLLMRKQISSRISNLALTGYLCLAGGVMFFPFALFQAISFDFSGVSPLAWGAIFYFGAVFTVLAYLFWFNGVSRVTGSTAGVFTAIMPVSAVVLSCIFLEERLTLSQAGGSLLVVMAILILALAPERKNP